MTADRHGAAALLGVALLLALLHATGGVLGARPFFVYGWEWFLKLGPGEARFYAVYLLGALVAAVFAWALAPLAGRVLPHLRNLGARYSLLVGLVTAGAMAAVTAIATGVLGGQVVTDDEYVYLFQARLLLDGRAAAPAPALSEFLDNVFVVTRSGRWFGQYPPGHPLLLTAGLLLGVPRILPVVVAGLNVLVTAAVFRRLFGAGWALAGALLLATSPLFLLTGATLLSHGTAALGVGLGLLGALRVWEGDEIRGGLLAGLGVALVVLARPWTGVTLGAFPLLLLGVAAFTRRRRRALIPAALVLLLGGVFFLAYNRAVTGDPFLTGYQAVRGTQMREFGFGTIIPGALEHTPAQGVQNAALLAARFHVWSWGWPLALVPALLAFLPRRHAAPEAASRLSERAAIWGSAAMVLTGLLSYIPYWSIGVADTGPVKTYELLLPFGVLTVAGARRWGERRGGASPVSWILASWLCAAALFWPGRIEHLRGVSAGVAEPLAAVRAGVRRPALVFVANVQPREPRSWVYGRPNPRPDLRDPILYVRDLGPRNLEYARLHPGRFAYRLVHDGAQFLVVPLMGELTMTRRGLKPPPWALPAVALLTVGLGAGCGKESTRPPVPRAPVLAPIPDPVLREGKTREVPVSATDADGDAVSLSASGLPGFAAFDDLGDNTGILTLSPAIGDTGSYPGITLTASDGELMDIDTLTVTVTGNRPPELDAVSVQVVTEGEVREIPILAVDPDDDELTVTGSGLPGFASLVEAGEGAWTLTLSPLIGDAGTYPDIAITASDGNLEDVEIFTVAVSPAGASEGILFYEPVSFCVTGAEDADTLRVYNLGDTPLIWRPVSSPEGSEGLLDERVLAPRSLTEVVWRWAPSGPYPVLDSLVAETTDPGLGRVIVPFRRDDPAGASDIRPPDPPLLALPLDGAVFAVGDTVDAVWSELDDCSGISHYRIEISATPNFASILCCREEILGSFASIIIDPGDEGTVYWRVYAEDGGGLRGPPSDSRSWTVVN